MREGEALNAESPVALVTGSRGGVGRELIMRLRQAGMVVAGLDVPRSEVTADPEGVFTYDVDVCDEAAVHLAVEDITERLGPVHHLVCTPGIFVSRPFMETDAALWARIMATNLRGPFLCSKAVLPEMLRCRRGNIIYVSSMLARSGGENTAAYSMSMGGLLGLARSLALETAAKGIRVNTVSPELTDTPQPRGYLTDDALTAPVAAFPMGRAVTPADVVEACLFLLDEDASYMTGQDLRVNGGSHLW